MTTGLMPGKLLPAFSLQAANRAGVVGLWNYKPRRNLALLFVPEVEQYGRLLDMVADHYSKYGELESETLVISPEPVQQLREFGSRHQVPFPLLHDPENQLRETCLGDEPGGLAVIADRWGEVYGRMKLEASQTAGTESEIRNWLEFVNQQCAECFPPEWPAER
jgi:peroxiredoxin